MRRPRVEATASLMRADIREASAMVRCWWADARFRSEVVTARGRFALVALGVLLLLGVAAGVARAEEPSAEPSAPPSGEPSAPPSAEPSAPPSAEPSAAPTPTQDVRPVALSDDDRARIDGLGAVLAGGFCVTAFLLSASLLAGAFHRG